MKPEINDLSTYFPHLEEFAHKALFDNLGNIWDVLGRINPYIRDYIDARRAVLPSRELPGTRLMQRTMHYSETILVVDSLVEVDETMLVKDADILLEKGVVLEPGAMIKAPAIIGADTEVRQGAYVRGGVITGEHCTIGHTTEMKNAVFMNHTEAGHFAYVGDSVCGSYVNLGAGCKLANLQLRRAADKLKGNFPSVTLNVGDERLKTAITKIGVIFGDHGEAGCNAVTAPGVFLGAHSWVFANATVIKGFYAPKTILR